MFLHRLGKDRAGENNAIKILASSDNKDENEEVDYCEIDQPSVINEGECIENVHLAHYQS